MNRYFPLRLAKYNYVLAEDALMHFMGVPVSDSALHIVASSFAYESGDWHDGIIQAKAFYIGTQWHEEDLITHLADHQ